MITLIRIRNDVNEYMINAFIDELEKLANNFGMLPPMMDDPSFYQPPIASSPPISSSPVVPKSAPVPSTPSPVKPTTLMGKAKFHATNAYLNLPYATNAMHNAAQMPIGLVGGEIAGPIASGGATLAGKMGQGASGIVGKAAKWLPTLGKLASLQRSNEKTAEAIAVKRDPQKWEQAKEEAKAKMGGKHSARAMQLAVKLYKDNGGTYSGKKPTPANNSMRKWTKQDWQTRPGTSEIAQKSDGSTSRYLPKKKWDNLSHKEQVATDNKKLNADTQYISNTSSAKVKGNAKYY